MLPDVRRGQRGGGGMTITYIRNYHGQADTVTPVPDHIRAEAERGVVMLHPGRRHVYSCGERGGLRLGQPMTNPSWTVIYEPTTEGR
jgi:hypothetical protein